MRLKFWASRIGPIVAAVCALALVAGVHVRTQAPFVVFGSNSGTPQPIKSTGNALWASIQGGPIAGQINPDSICLDHTNKDVCLQRDAANTLALRNGTNAQTFNVYRTYTDGSNFALGFLGWSGNTFVIGRNAVGASTGDVTITGGTASGVNFAVNNSNTAIWSINSTGNFLDQGSHTITAGSTIAAGGLTPAGTFGTPVTVGYGNVVGATNTGTASIAAFTVGAADATFEVGCNVLVTTSTTHSFSCDVTYTDEGSSSRTLVLPVAQLAGSFVASGLITNVTGAGPYESAALHIRAKAATVITVRTSAGGTFTTVVYNARGRITEISQ